MWNGVFFFLWLVMLIVINEEKKDLVFDLFFKIIMKLMCYIFN